MSVKELKLDCLGGKLNFHVFAGNVLVMPIVEQIGDQISLDRNQAHLLMLYLQEHLGYKQ